MSGISQHQAGQSDLELAARDLAVLLCPYDDTHPLLPTLEGVGGALTIPPYYVSVGNFTKAAGVTLGHTPEINDIESHGKASPTRQMASRRVITIGFEPQETKLINLALYWGTDWLQNVPDLSATGGFAEAIPELPLNLKFRAILLGWDDFNGEDIFIYWIANKVNVSATTDTELVDSNVIRYPYTLNCQADDQNQSALTVGICGPGWEALQAITDTGFGGS
jgi:hypothetical protein